MGIRVSRGRSLEKDKDYVADQCGNWTLAKLWALEKH